MRGFRSKFYIFLFVVITICFFMLPPRGSTVLNTTISLAPDGKPVFNSSVDKQGAISEKENSYSKIKDFSRLYGQSVEKTDYGIVAYYKVVYSFNFKSLPKYAPAQFIFSADLPGTIIEAKEGDVFKSKVSWTINAGEDRILAAKSKIVRWPLIVLIIIVTIAIFYAIFIIWRRRGRLN